MAYVSLKANSFKEAVDSPYGYIPSKTATLAFMIVFALSTVTHIGQAIYTKSWWLLPTVCICGALEVAGWGGRYWSHNQPWVFSAYLLQICTTIMAPTFMLAAIFVIFGRIIEKLGTGGGLASVNVKIDPAPGGHIMLGGIAFQLGIEIPPLLWHDVLDGAMVTLAIYCLNFLHPGFLLSDTDAEGSKASY
ncbi:hypothetical protein H0H93_011317 [Arthromyces matolae]|nr:hypothetical protein H0H93_011317 [Arthromyces matolae]